MKTSKQTLPTLAGIAAATIWGFSFFSTKTILGYISPFHLLGLRFAVASLAIMLVSVLGIVKIKINPSLYKDLLVIALLHPVIYYLFETFGIKMTSATESGVIIALIPVFVAVLSGLILKEKVTGLQFAFIIGAVCGVILIVLGNPQNGNYATGHGLGFAMLLIAVTASALYRILTRKHSKDATPLEITTAMMWIGALTFTTTSIIEGIIGHQLGSYLNVLMKPEALFHILYLGLFCSVAAFFLQNYALTRLTAAHATIFMCITPVVATFAGIMFAHEHLTHMQFGGVALILLGVFGTGRFAPAKQQTYNPKLPSHPKDANRKT